MEGVHLSVSSSALSICAVADVTRAYLFVGHCHLHGFDVEVRPNRSRKACVVVMSRADPGVSYR